MERAIAEGGRWGGWHGHAVGVRAGCGKAVPSRLRQAEGAELFVCWVRLGRRVVQLAIPAKNVVGEQHFGRERAQIF